MDQPQGEASGGIDLLMLSSQTCSPQSCAKVWCCCLCCRFVGCAEAAPADTPPRPWGALKEGSPPVAGALGSLWATDPQLEPRLVTGA